MAFLGGRWSWGFVYWALLLPLLADDSLVQAGNVVSLAVDWKEPPPGELLRRLKTRSHVEEGIYNNRSTHAWGAYMANVTVGTPGQSLSLVIDNGWSDTIVLAASAYECNQKSWADGDGPCFGGTFDPARSSTFRTTVPNGLGGSEVSGNPDGDIVSIQGDYFTDAFAIGGVQITGLPMGLALDSSNSTIFWGILGLGRTSAETLVANATLPPNLLEQMVLQSLINTRTFSLYMNELNSTTGSIVFGGIDTRKFSGTLGVMDSPFDAVDVGSISIIDSQGNPFVLLNSTEALEQNFTANFYISSPLTYVPEYVLANVVSYFGAIDDRVNTGVVLVDCEKLTTEAGAVFEFAFGRSVGPTIKVPMSEMILPLSYALEPVTAAKVKTPFANTCMLGITAVNQTINYVQATSWCDLGNTFLRSAYAVFDLDHNQTALAQTVYGVTDFNIVELSASETGIPALSGAAASSSTPGSGFPNGAGSSESNSKSGRISSGAIAGIVIGVLVVVGAVGFLAFLWFRRRRAARPQPGTEDPTKTQRVRAHEVPGEDHEIEQALAIQDGKQDVLEDQVLNPITHEMIGKDYKVEESELAAQEKVSEVPSGEIGTGALPRELESQVPQRQEHELLGSSEHPVEALSATYSPAHAELDSYGAISPDQLEIASVPELPAESMQRKPLPPQSPVSRISGMSFPDSLLPGTSVSEAGRPSSLDAESVSSGPSKVDILQDRLERVRAEKGRLAKMTELEEMEVTLQEEIMAELRKEHGSDGTLS